MEAAKKVILLTSSSQESEQEEIIISKTPSSPANQFTYFEMADSEEPIEQSILSISTNKTQIMTTSKKYLPKTLTEEQWVKYLAIPQKQELQSYHIDLVYSLVRGLDYRLRQIYWTGMCKTYHHQLKIHPIADEKYDTEIKASVSKLGPWLTKLAFKDIEIKIYCNLTESILKKYYKLDPQVGYARLMEYIAIGIVIALNENNGELTNSKAENIEVYFSYFMRKLNLRDMFFPGQSGLFSKIHELQTVLAKQLPALYKRINHLQLYKIFYKYFMTLCMFSIPHRSLIAKVFDLMLLDGHSFVIYLLKRLLEQDYKRIMELSQENLIKYLKNDIITTHFASKNGVDCVDRLERLLIKCELRTN